MGLCVPVAKCFSDIFVWVGQTALSKWSPGILWPFKDRKRAEKEALETLQENNSGSIDLLPSEAIWIPCIDHCCSNGWDGIAAKSPGEGMAERTCRDLYENWYIPVINGEILTPMLAIRLQVLLSMSPFSLGNSGPCPVLCQNIHHRATNIKLLMNNTWVPLFLATTLQTCQISALLTVYCLGPRKMLLHVFSFVHFIQSYDWGLLGYWHKRQTLTQSMEERWSAGAPQQQKSTKGRAQPFSQKAWWQQILPYNI